jgi:hypothetical protein
LEIECWLSASIMDYLEEGTYGFSHNLGDAGLIPIIVLAMTIFGPGRIGCRGSELGQAIVVSQAGRESKWIFSM